MSDDILECCDCGHIFAESKAKLIPYADDINADYLVCPQCECKDHYSYEVTDD